MQNLALDIDLSDFQQEVFDQVAHEVSQGIRLVAQKGADMWRELVMQSPLWPEGEKIPYIESIKWDMDGPFAAEISTSFDLAGEIETGRPPKDLKKMLQTSQKIRISASKKHNGQKYLIIPFRHNTPGNAAHAASMPLDIYAQAKNLKQTRLLPPGSVNPPTRISGSGHTVAQHSYQWGGRLPAGLAPKMQTHHKTDIYAGMVRMQTSSGKQKSSAYLTFRVMGEWSNGWVVPARPGLHLAKKVAENLQPIFEATMGQALKLASN